MQTKQEIEFIKDLEIASKEFSLLNYFLDSKDLSKELFAQYIETEQRPMLRLYLGKEFTEDEWINAITKNNENIPVNTSSAVFVSPSNFDNKVNELQNEFYKLINENRLPKEYHSHQIDQTHIYIKLKQISEDIKDFKNRVTVSNKDDYKEYAETIANSLIRHLEDINIHELTTILLADLVNEQENIYTDLVFIIDDFMRVNNDVSKDDIKRNDRELKRYFDNVINGYLEPLKHLKKNTNRVGRKKTKIEPAINHLQGFNLPENKAKFLAELKKLYNGAEPKTFNHLIEALRDLSIIKIVSNKATREAFELEIVPQKQTPSNFNNYFRNNSAEPKLLKSIKSEIEMIREENQLF